MLNATTRGGNIQSDTAFSNRGLAAYEIITR